MDRAADWPVVHSATALIEGKALVGHWYDCSKEHAARRLRGEEEVDPMRFATEEHVVLSLLPCWEHLPLAEYRKRVAALVATIDEEGLCEPLREGARP